VNYFDAAEELDPKVRLIVETKLDNARTAYESAQRSLLTKLYLINGENDQLKVRVKHLQKVIQ